MILSESELDLLKWLGQEDFSQYGECCGKDLDSLIAKGLAQHHPDTGLYNTFIAKGVGIMFDKVSLTEAGIAWLMKRENESSVECSPEERAELHGTDPIDERNADEDAAARAKEP